MNFQLAQIEPTPTVNSKPEPARGTRVILDEQIQSSPKLDDSKAIPVTTYYWLGAIVLVIIACVAAASLYHKGKTNQSKPDNNLQL